jgi:hypothetical protein
LTLRSIAAKSLYSIQEVILYIQYGGNSRNNRADSFEISRGTIPDVPRNSRGKSIGIKSTTAGSTNNIRGDSVSGDEAGGGRTTRGVKQGSKYTHPPTKGYFRVGVLHFTISFGGCTQ